MSAFTCAFCNRISTNPEGWRQLFTRSLEHHDDEKTYMVCPKCHKTIIDEMLGQVVDPEMEFDAIREAMMDDDPTRDFIGMPLRDFLRSGMYLQTQNVFFVDKLGFPINDYMPCMGARVLTIEKQDTQGKTKVTLNYDPDLPAE